HYVAVWIAPIDNSAQIHEQEGELEGSPGGSLDSRFLFPLHGAEAAAGSLGHHAVGDHKRFEDRRVRKRGDALFDAIGGGKSPLEQRVGHLPALGVETGATFLLLFDPASILLNEATQYLLCRGSVGQCS